MVDVRVQVKLSGPVFDGRAAAAVDDFVAEAVDAVATQGVTTVRQQLHQVLRNPTGFYESQIQPESTQSELSALVTDGGVPYGPWLAGRGRRNQTSSFKGYPHWSRSTANLRQRVEQIAGAVLAKFISRMNG